MAGRRPLIRIEERALLKVVRKLAPRDRALVTTQWLTGFRISEVLSLMVGQVTRGRQNLPKIGIAPRNLKGGYGTTRWVPVLPELRRAVEKHLWWLASDSSSIPSCQSNDVPGILFYEGGELATALSVGIRGGKIYCIYAQRNPTSSRVSSMRRYSNELIP